MNRYFIHGAACDERTAFLEFARCRFVGVNDEDVDADWSECQRNEESRDSLLPSHIEIIQG